MNINVADLLNGNYILLLFVVLALGLCLGKLRLGSVQLGNSIGVLVVSLLLGQQHFAINTDALNLGFMLFIFCVGVEAGPNFFSIFFRDGKNYLMLALVMVGSAMLIAMMLGKVFGWDIGLTAGMLAGAMTSTPVLVGAGDTLRHFGLPSDQLAQSLDHLSLGYALTYLVGLVSLIVGARYMPKLQHQDLQTSAQQIARERGLDTDSKRKVYLPVIRAYRVGPELVAWADGKNLRELGIYRTTISRLLKRGRDQGIVTIAINYDYNENLWLEQQLKQKFGLKEAVVASSDGLLEEEQLSAMGQHGALLVDRLLEPGDIIGFSWGRAVRSLVENLPQASHSRQVICVPIIGGPSGKLESRYHVNTLTYGAAARLKAESHLADFPALLDNPLIRNGIMQSQHFKTISSYWDSLDVALVGIGSPAIRDGANWHAFYGSEESDDLNARHVAGDICSRFYDINGGLVDTNMSEKTLSIEMAKLRQARYSIGIAMGEEKYSGILGALHGRYINCLVTNRETAELLLK